MREYPEPRRTMSGERLIDVLAMIKHITHTECEHGFPLSGSCPSCDKG